MKYELYYGSGAKETFESREEALLGILKSIDYFYPKIEEGNYRVFSFLVSIFKERPVTKDEVEGLIQYYKRLQEREKFPFESLINSRLFR